MYALKCSVNGEIFKTTFDKSSLPIAITFQEGNVSCGLIAVNANNYLGSEINIGGFDTDGGYALADGAIDRGFYVPKDLEFTAHDITIEFLPYETNGDELNGGDKDVYYLIDTGTLPKTITSCAFFITSEYPLNDQFMPS